MNRSIKPAIAGFLWAVLLFAGIGYADAATIRLNCALPVTNTDGSVISGAIVLKAYWGTSATALTNSAPLSSCTNGLVTVPDPAAGATITYHLAVTATVAGIESAKSNVASKAITTPLPTPNPPTGLVADVGAIAYSIKPDYTTFGPMRLSKQVGTVRTKTTCIARQRIAGTDFYRVPKSAVAFLAGATDYVVAMCS